MRPMQRRSAAGFTLIELMIAVVVVAILAAVAYPNYSEQVRKSRRAEAKSLIGDAANRLERCYTRFNAYNAAGCEGIGSGTSEGGYYALSLQVTANSYTLTATPQGKQADDPCGAFSLSHTGVRGLGGSDTEGHECW